MTDIDPHRYPLSALAFAPAAVEVDRRADGTVVLRSPQRLGEYARSVGTWLDAWAARAPERVFLAERQGAGWRSVTYAAARTAVRAIAAGLLSRGLSAERPVAILSDNGVDHALLALGAMHVGIPAAPISPAYSLMSKDFAKLRTIFALLEPGMVYAVDGGPFATALDAVHAPGLELVVSGSPPPGRRATPFASLLDARPGAEVDAAFAAVGPDTVAKILFTSGSTGEPKGVINTHRMLTSNQQAYLQVWPFLEEEPPVLVDWLPWNHTFGANSNFNMVLSRGGTLYVDGGKPAPGLIDRTVENLREVPPTLYFNVPRGFDMLLPYLERDADLRRTFFSRLKLIFYAGAALPQHLWERLERLAVAARGERVRMISAWGSTETAPMATVVHFALDRAGIVGLPAPGSEIKLVPVAGAMEARVRGPNVTPGYWKRPDLTAEAFDAEGFYRIGDALRWADAGDPARGLEFGGRLAEEFKLTSGTWVHTGALRVRAIAALSPVAQDLVVTGHDRDEVGALVFPDIPGCRSLAEGLPPDAPLGDLLAHPAVAARVRDGLGRLKAEGGGGSTYATRALLLEEPPSIDANEITDKGYLNQRAVLMRRAALVEALHAASPGPGVIRL
jgi:feruloyl-CoA synthase